MAVGKVIESVATTGLIAFGLALNGKDVFLFSTTLDAVVQASGGIVVRYFSVSSETRAICFKGKDLLAIDYTAAVLNLLDLDGNVIEAIAMPGTGPVAVCFDGRSYWVSDVTEQRVYQLNLQGEEITSFARNDIFGIATDGLHLFLADYIADTIEMTDKAGNIIFSFAYGKVRDIDFDGRTLWALRRLPEEVAQISIN